MLSVITRVSRARALQRPGPPFTVNLGSWQAQGLIAFWPLGQPTSAGYLDLMGRAARRLTQNGTMAIATGPSGSDYAPSNTGSTSNWLSLAPAVKTAIPLTMACWAYFATTTVAYNLIVQGDTTAGTEYFNLSVNTPTVSRISAGTATAGAEKTAISTINFSALTWGHAAGVWTGIASRAAYWNGGSKGTEFSSSTPTPASVTNVYMAGYRVGSSTFGPLNGRMAHACIWDRALSDDEVMALYDPQWRWDLYYPLGRRYLSFAPLAAGWVPRQRAWGLTQAAHRAGHY